jgi:hypothetical protein
MQFCRLDTGTARFMICRNCIRDRVGHARRHPHQLPRRRALFNRDPAPTDHNGETAGSRLARRAANWTPAAIDH